MKLLHIIASMDPVSGGPCQGIRNSNPDMINLGVYREVVCLDAPDASFLGMDNFPVHALGPGKGPWQYSEKLKPWLMANMERFDVVVINGLWLYSSYAGWRVMKTLKKQRFKQSPNARPFPKVFIMPHGMLDPYFQNAPDRKLKAIRNWFYWKLIENRVVNDADGLLFTCEIEMQLAGTSFSPYRPKKEINVGYGIINPPVKTLQMVNAFAKACPGLNGENYLLFLSRIHEKKGVDLLLQAYAAIFEQTKKQGIKIPKLVIAGPGLESPYGKKMRLLVSGSPLLKQAVLFPGMLRGDAKWGAIHGCDCFVLPSHQENFGIAVVEALACSKPVLISNQVNIWMEIQNGSSGIVENDNLNGTTNLLERWLALTVTQKQQMAANAVQVFNEHFDVAHASATFHKTIASIN
ncbi:glycosyltransferase [Mucilaginibacter pallidiroseus]|uniref:Glycosyltransferase n=1 Tax=Mucilaginibacter pallidiroseus TaxID=2599295 RepID=A0A563U8B0_9SPHI|nr:glycosyltransferase [Mucilaginibacter pallidiroseus]TWR27580.1 glycosyltransferase [Mucilaginibacter pallidiroseus]